MGNLGDAIAVSKIYFHVAEEDDFVIACEETGNNTSHKEIDETFETERFEPAKKSEHGSCLKHMALLVYLYCKSCSYCAGLESTQWYWSTRI